MGFRVDGRAGAVSRLRWTDHARARPRQPAAGGPLSRTVGRLRRTALPPDARAVLAVRPRAAGRRRAGRGRRSGGSATDLFGDDRGARARHGQRVGCARTCIPRSQRARAREPPRIPPPVLRGGSGSRRRFSRSTPPRQAGWPPTAPWSSGGGFRRRRGGSMQGPPIPAAPGYDLIVDHYLLSHLDRPRAALATLSGMLGPDGTLVLETDHLLSIVEGCQFDAIRHGHRSYLGLSWLRRELEAVDLHVVDARIEPVYGGALRVWARRAKRVAVSDPDGQVAVDCGARRGGGHRHRRRHGPIRGERRTGCAPPCGRTSRTAATDGRRVVGYGAPARAVTFLNAAGIGPELLPVTADRASSKQGCVVPGVGLPIIAPDELRGYLPADVLILAWDLADEIRAGMPWVEEGGGRWLVAVAGAGGRQIRRSRADRRMTRALSLRRRTDRPRRGRRWSGRTAPRPSPPSGRPAAALPREPSGRSRSGHA